MGTLYWTNGDRYVGDFLDGERTGQGTYTWASGSSWTGEFLNSERTENGSYNKSPEDKAFEKQSQLDLMRQQTQQNNALMRSILGWKNF